MRQLGNMVWMTKAWIYEMVSKIVWKIWGLQYIGVCFMFCCHFRIYVWYDVMALSHHVYLAVNGIVYVVWCYCLSWCGYRLAGVVHFSNHSQMIPKPGQVNQRNKGSSIRLTCVCDTLITAKLMLILMQLIVCHLNLCCNADHSDNSDASDTQPMLMLKPSLLCCDADHNDQW